jgi:hypothetical protein
VRYALHGHPMPVDWVGDCLAAKFFVPFDGAIIVNLYDDAFHGLARGFAIVSVLGRRDPEAACASAPSTFGGTVRAGGAAMLEPIGRPSTREGGVCRVVRRNVWELL